MATGFSAGSGGFSAGGFAGAAHSERFSSSDNSKESTQAVESAAHARGETVAQYTNDRSPVDAIRAMEIQSSTNAPDNPSVNAMLEGFSVSHETNNVGAGGAGDKTTSANGNYSAGDARVFSADTVIVGSNGETEPQHGVDGDVREGTSPVSPEQSTKKVFNAQTDTIENSSRLLAEGHLGTTSGEVTKATAMPESGSDGVMSAPVTQNLEGFSRTHESIQQAAHEYIKSGEVELLVAPGMADYVRNLPEVGSGNRGIVYESPDPNKVIKESDLVETIAQSAAMKMLKRTTDFQVPDSRVLVDPEFPERGFLEMDKMSFLRPSQIYNQDSKVFQDLCDRVDVVLDSGKNILDPHFTWDVKYDDNWGITEAGLSRFEKNYPLKQSDIVIFDPTSGMLPLRESE